MAIYDEASNRYLCECGCGEEVSDCLARFRRGHQMKTEEYQWNLSNRFFGKPMSEKGRQNVQAGVDRTLRIITDEFRQKMSTAMLKIFQDDPTLSEKWSEVQKKRYRENPEAGKILSGSLNRFWRSEEGKAKRASISGENSPNWKGGKRGSNQDYGYNWRDIKFAVKLRDNFTCQSCSSTRNIVTHHIDSNRRNGDERNLIATCISCNSKASGKWGEQFWFEFYTEKIKEIYSDPVRADVVKKFLEAVKLHNRDVGVIQGAIV